MNESEDHIFIPDTMQCRLENTERVLECLLSRKTRCINLTAGSLASSNAENMLGSKINGPCCDTAHDVSPGSVSGSGQSLL